LIEWRVDQLVVTDLHSSNGTDVVSPDGTSRRLTADVATVVQVTDRVQVGSAATIEFLPAVADVVAAPPAATMSLVAPVLLPVIDTLRATPIGLIAEAYPTRPLQSLQPEQTVPIRDLAPLGVPVPPPPNIDALPVTQDSAADGDRLLVSCQAVSPLNSVVATAAQ